MLGLHDTVAPEITWGLGGFSLLLGMIFLVRGLRRFRWPRRDEAIERLDATMPGRPIQEIGRAHV